MGIFDRFRKNKIDPTQPQSDPGVQTHEFASVRRDHLWTGLFNSISTGRVDIIRRYLSRANIIVGDLAKIEDDVEFLRSLKKALGHNPRLKLLVPTLESMIEDMETSNAGGNS